jgi:hypothetical protein
MWINGVNLALDVLNGDSRLYEEVNVVFAETVAVP